MKKYFKTCFLTLLSIIFISLLPGCGGGGGSSDQGDGINQDISLNVPFVPNYGGTCVSSSFTMVMQYYDNNVTFEDVFSIFGFPPFDDEYEKFENWVENNFDLKYEYFHDRTIDDVILCIDAGYPVVVHQQFKLDEVTGHNRVVIGYNREEKILILNDPSTLGPNYRMPFDTFAELWFLISKIEPVPPNQLFLILPKSQPVPFS